MTRTVQLVSAGNKGGVAGTATVLASRKYHGKELAQGLVQVIDISITCKQRARQILVRADDRNAEPEIVAGVTTLADVPPGYVAVIRDANTQAVQQDTVGTAKGGVQPTAGECAELDSCRLTWWLWQAGHDVLVPPMMQRNAHSILAK
jgi:hypothetical protein